MLSLPKVLALLTMVTGDALPARARACTVATVRVDRPAEENRSDGRVRWP
jgi:hypothetical protein